MICLRINPFGSIGFEVHEEIVVVVDRVHGFVNEFYLLEKARTVRRMYFLLNIGVYLGDILG